VQGCVVGGCRVWDRHVEHVLCGMESKAAGVSPKKLQDWFGAKLCDLYLTRID